MPMHLSYFGQVARAEEFLDALRSNQTVGGFRDFSSPRAVNYLVACSFVAFFIAGKRC